MASYSTSTTGSIKYIPVNLSASEGLTINIDNPLQGSSYVVLETRKDADGKYTAVSPKNAQGTYTLSNITKEVHDDYKAGFVVPPGGGTVTFDNTNYVSGSEFRIQGTKEHPFYDTLLDRWPNAAAAYSLRLLNSYYEGPAIRVRRSIGDTEANIGFSGGQLDTTALTNFTTNAGTALPGDYGDGAAAAYSLRYVSSTYSGPVIKVRRDSDDQERDFTPSEITDGTLETWVNEDVVTYISNFSSGFDGVTPQKLTGEFNVDGVEGINDTLKLTLKTGNEEWWSRRSSTFVAGNTYTITLDIYIPSSNTLVDNVRIGSTGNGTDVGTISTVGEWTTATFNFTAVSSTLGIRAYDGNSGFFAGNGTDHFYVKNIQVTQTTSNGFVETWYDQSGNSNDATQSTASEQPQIVSSGSTITENGKPCVQFDGSDDFFTSNATYSQPFTYFVTSKSNATSVDRTMLDGSSGTNFVQLKYYNTGNNFILFAGSILNGSTFTTNQNLHYALYNGSSSEIGLNNGSASTGNAGTNNPTSITIGSRLAGSGQFWDGNIQEIVAYPSDQSSNRTDIESNINNYYNIFPFDGYVKTWYDQSGNGNDASQTTAENQPQIVSSGLIVTSSFGIPSVKFDGVDDHLPIVNLASVVSGEDRSFNIFTTVQSSTSSANTILGFGGAGFAPFYSFTLNNTDLEVIKRDNTSTLIQNPNNTSYNGSFTSLTSLDSGTTLSTFNNNSIVDDSITFDVGAITFTHATLGALVYNTGNTLSSPTNGNITEIILYTSDQSSNRTGIESNINSHYKIY